MSLWLTVTPTLYLMLHDSTFQGSDSEFVAEGTSLAQLGQETIPGIIHCGWCGQGYLPFKGLWTSR